MQNSKKILCINTQVIDRKQLARTDEMNYVKNQFSDQSRVDNSQFGKVRVTILTHNM